MGHCWRGISGDLITATRETAQIMALGDGSTDDNMDNGPAEGRALLERVTLKRTTTWAWECEV
jgi:hypothetical protein